MSGLHSHVFSFATVHKLHQCVDQAPDRRSDLHASGPPGLCTIRVVESRQPEVAQCLRQLFEGTLVGPVVLRHLRQVPPTVQIAFPSRS